MNNPDSQSKSESQEQSKPSTIRRLLNRVGMTRSEESKDSLPPNKLDLPPNKLESSDYSELPEGKPETLDNQTWFELHYFPLSEINFEGNRPFKKLLICDLKNLDQLQVLGRGSSGTVYRLSFCPRLAMKVFENKQYADIALQHEAAALAKLEGENHIEGGRVTTIGLADKRVFWLILYSFIEGKNATDYLFGKEQEIQENQEKKSKLSSGKLAPLYRQREIPCASEAEKRNRFLQSIELHHLIMNVLKDVLTGLQGLHENGTIHRDIKPDNFMMQETKSGRVVTTLIDFGIACHEGFIAQEFMGTPTYASPESFPSGEPVRIFPSVDIYSVSKVLEQMIRGIPPLEGVGGFLQIQVQHYFLKEGSQNKIVQETVDTLKCLEQDFFTPGNAYYHWVEDILKSGGNYSPENRPEAVWMLQKIHSAIEVLELYRKRVEEAEPQKTLTQILIQANKILINLYTKLIQDYIQILKNIVDSPVIDLENDPKKLKMAFLRTQEFLKRIPSLSLGAESSEIEEPFFKEREQLKISCQNLEEQFFHQIARLSADTLNSLDRPLQQLLNEALEQGEVHLFEETLKKLESSKNMMQKIFQPSFSP